VNLSDQLKRLNAAVDVIRYRQTARKFLQTLHDLCILPRDVINSISSSHALIEMDKPDIRLSETENLKKKLELLFGGISPIGLEVVNSIQKKLIDFLEKKSEGFDQILSMAMTNFTGDDHVILILNSLQAVKKFLEPFYSHSFQHINHLAGSIVPLCLNATSATEIPIFAHLKTVTQQLEAIECYYFKVDESGVSSEHVLNFIRNIFPYGSFVSSLKGGRTGETLTFASDEKTLSS